MVAELTVKAIKILSYTQVDILLSAASEAKNLGVIFDSDNSFDKHIDSVWSACCDHLYDLRRICTYLSADTAIMVANSMLCSSLDYCNSLLYGVSKLNIAKLQRVQNALYHVVFSLDRMSHASPFLVKLHWLLIQYCVLLKYNFLKYD